MDKNKGSLTIKFSGKEVLDLGVLSKLSSLLLNALNKISLTTANVKNEYNVSYTNGDGFGLLITQENVNDKTIIDNDVNVFNVFTDLLSIRRFISKTGKFTSSVEEDYCVIDNEEEKETFNLISYNIYTSDNVIEDSLSKLSSLITNKKNSFQVVYKNGILERKITYSKEDLDKTAIKINLDSIICSKEVYNATMSLQVEQLDLSASGSWKFKDITNFKSAPFKAKIKDKEFTKNLKSGNVIIGYGLILKGEVKTTIVKDRFGKIIPSKATYVIEKVHDVLYSDQADLTSLTIE